MDLAEINRDDVALSRSGAGDAHIGEEIFGHHVRAEDATGELQDAFRLESHDLTDSILDDSEVRDDPLIDVHVTELTNERQIETGDTTQRQSGALLFLKRQSVVVVRCRGVLCAGKAEHEWNRERGEAEIHGTLSFRRKRWAQSATAAGRGGRRISTSARTFNYSGGRSPRPAAKRRAETPSSRPTAPLQRIHPHLHAQDSSRGDCAPLPSSSSGPSRQAAAAAGCSGRVAYSSPSGVEERTSACTCNVGRPNARLYRPDG